MVLMSLSGLGASILLLGLVASGHGDTFWNVFFLPMLLLCFICPVFWLFVQGFGQPVPPILRPGSSPSPAVLRFLSFAAGTLGVLAGCCALLFISVCAMAPRAFEARYWAAGTAGILLLSLLCWFTMNLHAGLEYQGQFHADDPDQAS
jgi:hypothetical protein